MKSKLKSPETPEIIVLPEHIAWILLLYSDRLELWNAQEDKGLSYLHLPPHQPISLQKINKRYDPRMVFIADNELPKTINNPKNYAFIFANFNLKRFTVIGPTPKDISPLTADEMLAVSRIAEHLQARIGDMQEEKFYHLIRSLALFIEWERQNYQISCIRTMLLENPELRKFSKVLYKLICALRERIDVAPIILRYYLDHDDPAVKQLDNLTSSICLQTALAKSIANKK